jgi:hypothetical protein
MVAVDGHSKIKPAFHEWNRQFPAEWRTTSLQKLELVVIITEVEQRVGDIEYREKKLGSVRKIPSFRHDVRVEVRQAQTAEPVASNTFEGPPPPVPEELSGGVPALHGETVSREPVEAWLRPIIAPSR